MFLFLLALIAAAPPVHAGRQIVPIAGHTPGALGTMWRTDLMLFNSTGRTDVVTFTFHATDGTIASRSISLAAGESRLIADAADPALFGGSLPSSWLGQMEIISTYGIHAHARIYAEDSGGTYGSCFPVLDPLSLRESGTVAGVRNNARFRTNVALMNAANQPVTFQLRFRSATGSQVQVTPFTVAAQQTIQVPLTELTSAAVDVESFDWTSDGPSYVVASVIDNLSGDPTAIPSIADSETSLFFPIVGRTPGAAGTSWTTSLVVTSDGDTSGSVTLDVYDNTVGHLTRSLPLPPHGTLRIDDVFATLGVSNGLGYMSVNADVPVFGNVRVFNTTIDGATYGSLLLPQERSIADGQIHIRGVRRDRRFRLNVAIANTTGVMTAGTIKLLDDQGRPLESMTFFLPGHSSIQYSLPGIPEVGAGEVIIQSDAAAALTAVASNVDNRTGDTVIIEAEQDIER